MPGNPEHAIEPLNSRGSELEFVALRAEVLQRSATQQVIVGVQVTISGTVGAWVVSGTAHASQAVLLVLAYFSFVFWSLWSDHHFAIVAIGAFIKDTLSNEFRPIMRWEETSYKLPGPKLKLTLLFSSVGLLFPGVGVISVVVSARSIWTAPLNPAVMVLWLIAVAVTMLAIASFVNLVVSVAAAERQKSKPSVGAGQVDNPEPMNDLDAGYNSGD